MKRGYSASRPELSVRLRRIEGQIRGIERMISEDRYCIDVLTQIAAVRAALDGVALGLLDGHVSHCLLGEGEAPGTADDQRRELMDAVGRLVGGR